MIKIRDVCNISIEEKRASKEIGSSLEAELKIKINKKYKEILSNIDLSELCIVSKNDITFDEQSDILVGNYSIDINSRLIKRNDENLKITEREIEIILFLQNSKEPQSIENLQKEVWGHNSDLETHTVETHIYRLRKKISDKFNDRGFINSTKTGYKIK